MNKTQNFKLYQFSNLAKESITKGRNIFPSKQDVSNDISIK